MDRKAIIVIIASVAFIPLWVFVIVPKYLSKPAPPRPVAEQSTSPAPSASAPSAATSPALTSGTHAPTPFASSTAAEETLILTNAATRFVFTSLGGGVKQIELTAYPESTAHGKNADAGRVATLNTKAPIPVMALLGDDALQGDGLFELTRTATGVRAEKTLSNGLTIVKEFQPLSNYLFRATVRFENRSGWPLAIGPQEWVVGTATPMHAQDSDPSTLGVMWSDGGKTHDTPKSWFDNRSFMSCLGRPSIPRTEFLAGNSNVTWAAVHNQFFALVAIPPTNAPSMIARTVQLPMPPRDEFPEDTALPPPPVGFQTALVYPGLTLASNAIFERAVTFFAGPKEYRTLANIAEAQGNNLDQLMNFGFFGFVSKALLLGMNWLHSTLAFGYGLAIIAITLIIKMVFWPLTTASTRSMKRMAALQPQIKALQEKYKDDPAKMNRKVMEFMKEHKVSPLGGCLPMLLQIPVFFGFFTMIKSAIELRGAHFLWVMDLSKPDTLFHLSGFPVNLLPLLMGATMLWQARLQPPSPGMDPSQQKIMKYAPLMFMTVLYNYSAALTLYWTTTNLLTILQTKVTKMKDPAARAATPAAPARARK